MRKSGEAGMRECGEAGKWESENTNINFAGSVDTGKTPPLMN